MALACLLRRRCLLVWSLLPWKVVVGVAILFAAVQLAHEHGIGTLQAHAVGSGPGWADLLLRLAGVAALAANMIDNLPAYLVIEPPAAESPVRLAALLVGVNAGLLVTPWRAWPPSCGRRAAVPLGSM